MAIIKGEIESLKRLRNTFNERGIDRFNSLTSICDFLENFENEKNLCLLEVTKEFEQEKSRIKSDAAKLNEEYEKIISPKKEKLLKLEAKYQKKYDAHKNDEPTEFLDKVDRVLYLIFFKIMIFIIYTIGIYYTKIIGRKTKKEQSEIQDKLNYLTSNRETIIFERREEALRKTNYTKHVIHELYPLIAGAIGERLVEKELSKLPQTFTVLNDFSLKFQTPFFYKGKTERIFSIQIDHLLICNAGIFILETKNWSKKSIENLNLRSPVKQIHRTSYALYRLLNETKSQDEIGLESHAWGKREIPIRNVIVMIHSKPQERFQHVQIKTVHNLNAYIRYYDPIFSDDEVVKISNYLERLND